MNSDQTLNDYLTNIINSMIRSVTYKAAIFNRSLILFADNTLLFTIDNLNISDDIITSINTTSIPEDPKVIFNEVYNKYIFIKNIVENNQLVYSNPDLRSDPNFEQLLSYKSSDGAGFYYLISKDFAPFIPVFSGFPIINKTDKISLNLYKLPIEYQYIVEMDIYKSKLKSNYKLYYKILDVNHPL